MEGAGSASWPAATGRWDRVHPDQPAAPDPAPIPRPRDPEAELRARLADLSSTDPATGLPGRTRTQTLLEVAAWTARATGAVLGVLAVELRGVDALAVRFGRAAADDVLRAAAQRLRGRVRHGDIVGRLGPARFAAAVPGLAPATAGRETARLAGLLADALSTPFVVAGEEVVLGVRVGTALCPEDADDVPGLLGIAAAGETVVRG